MSSDSLNSTCHSHQMKYRKTYDVIKDHAGLVTDADGEELENITAGTTTNNKHFSTNYSQWESRNITSSTMSLMVTLFVVMFFTQSWTAPQWRNWTPQAVLYLKGAQGQRSVLKRTSRDRDDTFHLVSQSQNSDELGLSLASSILLELLQRDVDEGGHKVDDYPDEQALNLKYL